MQKHKAGLLEGPKISNRHQTATPEARVVIAGAKKDAAVTKIVLSEVMNLSGGMRRIKFLPVPAGFKVTVRGIGSQQTLFIYTRDPRAEQRIREYFSAH